jgi:hypothetical protein
LDIEILTFMLFKRTLHIRRIEPPLDTTTELRIVSIEKHPTKDKFVCVWSIDYLATRAVGYGKDELEALTCALQIINYFLRSSEKDGITVWWKEIGDYGGLPINLPAK